VAKMHDWGRGKWVASQVCLRCGATRWGKRAGGWGRAILDGKPQKYCKEKEGENG